MAKRDALAFSILANDFLTDADQGHMLIGDGLVLGELFGRFAVSLGRTDDLHPLANVHLMQATFLRQNGRPDDAPTYEALALCRLQQGDDAGVDECASRLIEIADKVAPEAITLAKELAPKIPGYDATFASAARGDQAAAATILDELDVAERNDAMPYRWWAVASGALARLDATDFDVRRRIIRATFLRAKDDERLGNRAAASDAAAVATRDLANLIEDGAPIDLSTLAEACALIDPIAAYRAAMGNSLILNVIEPKGTA